MRKAIFWSSGSMRPVLLLQLLEDCRNHLTHIAGNATIGNLEDRRIRVAVDGENVFTFVHAREMLHGSGDSDREIGCGLNCFPGLADLLGVGPPTSVDNRAGCAD